MVMCYLNVLVAGESCGHRSGPSPMVLGSEYNIVTESRV
jgi:hypothetical protein